MMKATFIIPSLQCFPLLSKLSQHLIFIMILSSIFTWTIILEKCRNCSTSKILLLFCYSMKLSAVNSSDKFTKQQQKYWQNISSISLNCLVPLGIKCMLCQQYYYPGHHVEQHQLNFNIFLSSTVSRGLRILCSKLENILNNMHVNYLLILRNYFCC